MTNAFVKEFENLKACGFDVQCHDLNQQIVAPRMTIDGDFHFDHFADQIASVSILPTRLVTVSGMKTRSKGYFDPTVIGSLPDTAQFHDEASGVYVWILQPTVRLPEGGFAALDANGNEFKIRVHGERPNERVTLPPSPGLLWITEPSWVVPPRTVPSWVDRLCRGIGVQHAHR
jgi:hypothetical protein